MRFRSLLALLMSLTFFRTTAHAEPPSAELAAVLGKWQSAVSDLARYEVTGQRLIYNHVFEVQRCANFVVRYRQPDIVQIEIQPCDIAENDKSSRRTRDGRRYRLESDSRHLWSWSDKEVLIGAPGTGRILQDLSDPPAASPPKVQPAALTETPPPLWVELILRAGEFFRSSMDQALATNAFSPWRGLHLAFPEFHVYALFAVDTQFKHEFDWQIVKRTPTTIWVRGLPRSSVTRDNYRELTVILDKVTGRPMAQRTIDPSENFETVHIFSNWNLTPRNTAFHFDRRQWDFEVFTYPPEFKLLSHRRKE